MQLLVSLCIGITFSAFRWHCRQSVRTFFGQGAVGYDGHKKVKGRKRHFMVDSLGLLICVICMAANLYDIKAGRMMMNRLRNEARLERVRFLNVDGAYVSLKDPDDKIAIQISSLPKGSEFQPFPQRWKVERSISWSRGYRRLTMDFEKDSIRGGMELHCIHFDWAKKAEKTALVQL